MIKRHQWTRLAKLTNKVDERLICNSNKYIWKKVISYKVQQQIKPKGMRRQNREKVDN